MNLYMKLFGQFRAPAGDDGSDLPGPVDRGDDLPEAVTPEEAPQAEPETEVEVEADEEVEAEEEAKEEVKEETPPPKKHKQTANERVREVIEKSKAREAEYQAKIKELEASNQRGKLAEDFQAAETRLGEMEEKYAQLLMDGEAKEATKLRGEMRQLERAMYNEQARLESLAAKDAAKEEIKYDSTISSLEAKYPQIDPDSTEYDNEVVTEVLALHKGLMSQGLPPSMAISRAVKYVLGSSAPVSDVQASDKGLQRVKDAKTRNAAVVAKQPPVTSKVGFDSDKAGGPGPDAIMKMSYKEFSALSEEQLAKMRGDTI